MKHLDCMKAVKITGLLIVILFFAGLPASGGVSLPNVIGSNMVLQRNESLPIWGWAAAGESVTVELVGKKAKTKADSDGKWQVKLPKFKAGGPYQMTVTGKNTIQLSNILIGEVWVCSGQSNMEMGLTKVRDAEQEVAAANYPQIRLLYVPHLNSDSPKTDIDIKWEPCNAENIVRGAFGGFSAVGYFFGRELHKELKVPVGLIDASWGGSNIVPWTPPRGQYYKGMVNPLVPFAIRGAIWYQGESNLQEGMLYCQRMKSLIGGWRKVWRQGDFPFYYVQLAPYRYNWGNIKPTDLPEIWEAQTAAMSIKNTGMAVTVDIGDIKDIHPKNKQDVGKRLSLWALAKTYGRKNLVYSGPLYESMSIKGSNAIIQFKHTGSGLASRDGEPLTHFEIAGADRKYFKANAKIKGKTVVVSSNEVSRPAAVRFAWHHEAQPNLMNKESLPASPFRTDNPDWYKQAVVDLYKQAQGASSKADRSIALQGYSRVAGLESAKFSTEERMDMLRKAIKLASCNEEKKQIISSLENVVNFEALQVLQKYMLEPSLKSQAQISALKLARKLRTIDFDRAKAAAKQIARDDNAVIAEEVRKTLDEFMGWKIAGPYREKGKKGAELFKTVYPPENGSKDVNWMRLTKGFGNEKVNLKKTFRVQNYACAYVKAAFVSSHEQTVLLEMGSNDGIKAWLNGELIHSLWAGRACVPGGDVVKVKLRKGRNELLLKIVNETNVWEFSCRLRHQNGQRVKGLTFEP